MQLKTQVRWPVAFRQGSRTAAWATVAGLGLLFSQEASAVFTTTGLGTPRQTTLRVGSANGTINNVSFNVTGANVNPSPAAVTGVPGNGTPATSPANGTEIQVITRMPGTFFGSSTLTLTVDSSAGLSCVGGSGCGSTLIPFNTISWTSYNMDGGGDDLVSGTFNGSASQQLASRNQYTGIFSAGSLIMTNVLIFSYNNATLDPAGRYQGRVTYTATNL